MADNEGRATVPECKWSFAAQRVLNLSLTMMRSYLVMGSCLARRSPPPTCLMSRLRCPAELVVPIALVLPVSPRKKEPKIVLQQELKLAETGGSSWGVASSKPSHPDHGG